MKLFASINFGNRIKILTSREKNSVSIITNWIGPDLERNAMEVASFRAIRRIGEIKFLPESTRKVNKITVLAIGN